MIFGLATSALMWKRAHGLQRPSEQAIRKAGATDATLVEKAHLEPERILGAVLSGMGRLPALCSCVAGAGSAGRTGAPSAEIVNLQTKNICVVFRTRKECSQKALGQMPEILFIDLLKLSQRKE